MYMYMYVCHTLYIVHICIYIVYNIPRQLTCMKLQVLGNCISLYNPAMSLPISNKSVAVPRQDSIHPCYGLMLSCLGTATYVYTLFTCMYIHCMYVYVTVLVVKGFALLKLLTDTWALNYSSNYDRTIR